jgi:hypothetical protein
MIRVTITKHEYEHERRTTALAVVRVLVLVIEKFLYTSNPGTTRCYVALKISSENRDCRKRAK